MHDFIERSERDQWVERDMSTHMRRRSQLLCSCGWASPKIEVAYPGTAEERAFFDEQRELHDAA